MIENILKISYEQDNTFPLLARNSKLMEEVGEFSEAILYKSGYLPHKVMKEDVEAEAVDIILCVLDTLSAAYPELDASQLNELLNKQFEKKIEKWKSVIESRKI